MEFVDTHAHLDAFIENGTLDAALARAREAGVSRIISCSASPRDWEAYFEASSQNRGVVFWQLGVHPTEIGPDTEAALEGAGKFLKSQNPPVAIGEIGLDFHMMEGTPAEIERARDAQRRIFKMQLEMAKSAGLPVCIHARDAVMEAAEIITESGFDWKRVVFHCFSGTPGEMREINALGGRASFTGIITYKNAGEMREAMLAQGLGRLMLETDCPYLSPLPFRGKPNEPSRLPHTASRAAEVFGLTPGEIASATTRNAAEFFGL